MSFPKQYEIEIPLLKALEQLGGSVKPKAVYPLVTKIFKAQLTEEDLAARIESHPSNSKWHNLICWCRQNLVNRGDIENSTHGLWQISSSRR